MATSLEKLAQFLNNDGINHNVDKERTSIVTGFKTEEYRNTEGLDSLLVVIDLEEEGEYIKIFAPKCYSYKDGPHHEAVFQACLMISYATKMVQFEYDPSDGEVRAGIEFPLEDAELTHRQLLRCIRSLVAIVERYDGMIRRAMTDGVIEEPAEENPEELMQAFREFLKQRRKTAAAGSELGIEE